jgi:hypothetical protein
MISGGYSSLTLNKQYQTTLTPKLSSGSNMKMTKLQEIFQTLNTLPILIFLINFKNCDPALYREKPRSKFTAQKMQTLV